jgi:hypothetical protein
MPDSFKKLGEVLLKDKAFSKFRASVKENEVVLEFENIFPDLSKTVKANNVNKGILFLIVENSVLRSELYLQKSLIIEKVNKYFNQKVIVDVKFTNFKNSNRKIK